jgi:hypothetical protein
MVEKLIRCIRCNRVIPRYTLFGDFGESSTLPGVEWASDDLDEQKEFTKAHGGHPLEELIIDRQTLVSDRPAFEPCQVSYVEATNGGERFLIKRSKAGFDRPASYELIPGKIRVADISLEIQEEELRRQITWLNGSFPLPAEKVGKFIEAFREEVKGISKENWGEAMDMTLPGETSLLSYGSFRDSHWEKVLDRCQGDFQQSEIRMIEEFIREHRQPGDVLDLQIRKKFCISSPAAEMPAQTL